jgi:multicomponent Na+:H+ antiporter subunit F
MFEDIITYGVIPVLSISIFLVFLRLIIGPTVEDRIVAFDILTSIAIAFLSIYSLSTNSITILDVGIILALLAFLGTVAFAYYLERRTRK